jgi:hypothetical protein
MITILGAVFGKIMSADVADGRRYEAIRIWSRITIRIEEPGVKQLFPF